MRLSWFGIVGLSFLPSFVEADAAPPPGEPPEIFDVLCTVTRTGLSSDCRFDTAIVDPVERMKAGTVLGYLDAHPFPLPGTDPGATVKASPALRVVASADQASFSVTAPYGIFQTSSEPEVQDPVWRKPPHGRWTDDYLPERSVRTNTVGEVTVGCVVTATGVLADCRVWHESPPDGEFGRGATRVLGLVGMKTLSASGVPVAGRPYVQTFRYPGAKPGAGGGIDGHWAPQGDIRPNPLLVGVGEVPVTCRRSLGEDGSRR